MNDEKLAGIVKELRDSIARKLATVRLGYCNCPRCLAIEVQLDDAAAILDALAAKDREIGRLRGALEPFASAGRILPKKRTDITDVEMLVKVPTKVKYYLAAREALQGRR